MLPRLFHWSASRLLFNSPGYAKRLLQQQNPNCLHGLHPAIEAEFSLQVRLAKKAVKFTNQVLSVVLAITQNMVTCLNTFLRKVLYALKAKKYIHNSTYKS